MFALDMIKKISLPAIFMLYRNWKLQIQSSSSIDSFKQICPSLQPIGHLLPHLVCFCVCQCTYVMCAVQLATRMYTLCLYTDIRAVVCVDVMCSCWPHRQRSDARTGKPGVWSQVMALPRPHRPQLLNMRRLLTVGLSENCSTTDLFLFRSDPILRWENLTILHVSKNIAWFWGPDDELLLWKCVFENKFTRILNLNGKIGNYVYRLLSALSR